jgi:hypothetical protein
MRDAMTAYVNALHRAYLDAAALLPPAERTGLPLLAASDITVVAAGARYLHLLATPQRLPAPVGPEVEVVDELPGLAWRLRFLDPVVLPELGLVDESVTAAPGEVRRVIGVSDVLYHLSVSPGGGLTPHHASHAGTGLANQHAAAAREFAELRHRARGREELVDELAVATRQSLHHAVRALARLVAPGDPAVAAACADPNVDDSAVRRQLLTSLGGSR